MILRKIQLTVATLMAAAIVAAAAAYAMAQDPGPVPAAGVESSIVYETNFVDMVGLGWRAEFHRDLKPIARKGPYTV